VLYTRIMPASSAPARMRTSLPTMVQTASDHLYEQYPQHKNTLSSIIRKRFSTEATTPVSAAPTPPPFVPTLPSEETFSILEKVNQLSKLPGLTFDKETQLYLEQQLEDVLGFGISTSIDSLTLPFNKGRVESLSHLYFKPGLLLPTFSKTREAGLDDRRPAFGWYMQSPLTSQSPSDYPLYWVSLPLRLMVDPTQTLAEAKQAVYKKKVVVINPSEALFAIAEIMNDYTDASHKYQLGASPAVIRDGLFWSPENAGSMMIFFIPESSNAPKPGVYSLLP
jgi:hypothetical protein